MYPIMGSGRMRGDFWTSNSMPSEGGLQLKGSLEVNYFSSLLFTKSKVNGAKNGIDETLVFKEH